MIDTLFVLGNVTHVTSGKKFYVPPVEDKLHVTFLGRVLVPQPVRLDEYLNNISLVVSKFGVMNLVVGEEETFGINGEFTVRKVEKTTELHELHCSLADLSEQVFKFTLGQPQYVRQNFAPHVTVTPAVKLRTGDIVTVDNVVVSKHVGGLGGPIKDLLKVTL